MFAAAETGHRLLKRFLRKPQPIQHPLDLVVQIVGLVPVQFVLKMIESGGQPPMLGLLRGLGEGVGNLDRLLLETEQRFQGGAGLVPKRPARHDFRLLLQVAQAHGGMQLHIATVRLLLVGKDFQKRGLARSVRTYQPDPLARTDLELHAGQDRLRAVVFSEIRDAENNHSRSLQLLPKLAPTGPSRGRFAPAARHPLAPLKGRRGNARLP